MSSAQIYKSYRSINLLIVVSFQDFCHCYEDQLKFYIQDAKCYCCASFGSFNLCVRVCLNNIYVYYAFVLTALINVFAEFLSVLFK